jgi:hypothetical protein
MSVLAKFNAYAMVNPKTDEDYIALLDEALAELDNLTEYMNRLTISCEKNQDPDRK